METPTAMGVQRATAHRAALSESEWRIGQTVIHSPFFIERYPVGCAESAHPTVERMQYPKHSETTETIR